MMRTEKDDVRRSGERWKIIGILGQQTSKDER